MRSLYILSAVLVFTFGALTANAETGEIEVRTKIEAIKAQIAELQAKIRELEGREQGEAVSAEAKKLKLISKLEKGAEGEDVKILQKFLASDPSLYPEGLVTGFFGPLTEAAVKRFQAKIKLEQVGQVGPETLARINEILSAAGVTGDIPSDLLNSRVKIEIKIKDGREEVKIEIKDDDDDDEDDDEDEDDDDEDEDEDDSDDDDDEDEDD